MANFIFYCFATLLILGALGVVCATNPVKSVLSLIFCFLNAAALLLITGAEFIAAILIIVYIGAVIVLLLFIVMTLSTEENIKHIHIVKLPFFIAFIIVLLGVFSSFDSDLFTILAAGTHTLDNTRNIGMILYTDYFLQFQLAGIILLVALIGVIIITQRQHTSDVKKQNVWKQITTNPKDRILIVNKKSGEGI